MRRNTTFGPPPSGAFREGDARLSRRRLCALTGAFGLAGPVVLGMPGPGPLRASAEEGAPRRGGSLVMVIAGDPPTVNPDVTTGVPDVLVGGLVYEGLTRIDETFKAVPNLAKSWEVSPDNLRYTFHLVDAKWHDGQEFTSKDVKFTLEEVSGKYGAKFAASRGRIKSIETPDPKTVVIALDQPFGPFLFSLSLYSNCGMLPEHVFAGTNVLQNPATLERPVGTGPFMLKEWVRGQYIALARNPSYWREGKPYLDEVILRIIPEPASRVLALKAGEADYSYFYFFPASHYAEVAQDRRLQVRERGVPEDHLIIFNTRNAPFDNPKVRQALLMALDRNYVQKVVYQGLGKVMESAFNSNLAWAHNPDVKLSAMYPFNPEKAKALLDEAGLKAGANGRRFDLRLVYDSTDASRDRLSQVLQAMWGRIGVRVVFEGSTRNVQLKQVFTDWNFDATLQAYSTAGDPALGISRLYVSSAIRKAPFVNASGYSNPEVDRLFEAGVNATEEAERAKYYKEVQAILARDLPVIPVWETALMNVASARVKGKWAWSTGYSFWEEVWVEA